MTEDSGRALRGYRNRRKHRRETGVGTGFRRASRFSKEKAAEPDIVGLSGCITEERIVRLLFIK